MNNLLLDKNSYRLEAVDELINCNGTRQFVFFIQKIISEQLLFVELLLSII